MNMHIVHLSWRHMPRKIMEIIKRNKRESSQLTAPNKSRILFNARLVSDEWTGKKTAARMDKNINWALSVCNVLHNTCVDRIWQNMTLQVRLGETQVNWYNYTIGNASTEQQIESIYNINNNDIISVECT